jgi:RIO kinase 1
MTWREDWDDGEAREQFEQRAHKLARKRPGRRTVNSLLTENLKPEDAIPNTKFADPGLEELFERGLIVDLEWQLKSGKEATVYVCSSPHSENGLVAAKMYIDSRVRSFKNDAIYREGRHVESARLQKAIDQRSRTGVDAQNYLWVSEEFAQMNNLANAGVPVPKPLARSEVGSVILMEFIGDQDGAAPRLADAQLTKAQAQSAFEQSVHNLGLILGSGRVHGDYSTFNILWWQEQCIVIDFPQVVEIQANPRAQEILERDAAGLCRSFKHFGIRAEASDVLKQARKVAREIVMARAEAENNLPSLEIQEML